MEAKQAKAARVEALGPSHRLEHSDHGLLPILLIATCLSHETWPFFLMVICHAQIDPFATRYANRALPHFLVDSLTSSRLEPNMGHLE